MKYTETKPLSEQVSQTGITIVDFFASWCGPCRTLSPILDEIEQSGKATIIKIDTEDFPKIAEDNSVMSLPTMLFFKDGVQVKTYVGVMSQQNLEKTIEDL
jgi:thioredoxin 1